MTITQAVSLLRAAGAILKKDGWWLDDVWLAEDARDAVRAADLVLYTQVEDD